MLEDVSVVSPLRTGRPGGDFSGEEKMPSMFSMPCSSRSFSFSVMPVFLGPCQREQWTSYCRGILPTVLEHQCRRIDSLAIASFSQGSVLAPCRVRMRFCLRCRCCRVVETELWTGRREEARIARVGVDSANGVELCVYTAAVGPCNEEDQECTSKWSSTVDTLHSCLFCSSQSMHVLTTLT